MNEDQKKEQRTRTIRTRKGSGIENYFKREINI